MNNYKHDCSNETSHIFIMLANKRQFDITEH